MFLLPCVGMPYVRPMPKLSAVAGKSFFLKCPVAGYPIDSIIIEKGNTQTQTVVVHFKNQFISKVFCFLFFRLYYENTS